MSEKEEKFAAGCITTSLMVLYVLIAIFFIKYVNFELSWEFFVPVAIFVVVVVISMYKFRYEKPVFKMNRQDTFEGRYKNFVERQKTLVAWMLGDNAFRRIQNDKLAAEEIFRELLNNPSVIANSNDRFAALIGIGHALWEFADIDGALSYFKLAREIKPDDLIVNAELAWTYEAKDNADEAIKYYEAAMKDTTTTKLINAYLVSEIERVKTKGPRAVPPFTGMRFLV